ncbi:MAG: hypothetical protein WDN72_11425 [Alphaproteobacteria bacterium]
MPGPLTDIIRKKIRAEGPISIADYMALALGHPEHGYYRKQDPFGAAGDFITAPEISQIFGEMIGRLVRRDVAPGGVRADEPRRAGTGTRHVDGRPAARHQTRAGFP